MELNTKMIKINLSNTKKVEALFKEYGDKAVDAFEDVIFDEATKMAEVAKLKSPVDNGTLRNSINWEKENNLLYNVGTNIPYAPFMEFGTGGLVDIPNGWEDMALPFKGKGIKQVNISPQPFMYPAYLEGKKTFKKQMKLVIDKLSNKFNNG